LVNLLAVLVTLTLITPGYNYQFLRSAFEKFNRSEFMKRPEGETRILSTAVDMECDFPARTRRFGTEHSLGDRRRLASWCGKCECADGLFSLRMLCSATLCDMGRALLAAHSTVQKEKHYISVDMGLLGLQTRVRCSCP
ncbi:hypothetical protein JB92DRAFT_3076002, partial [Gautieria morchelliformis]